MNYFSAQRPGQKLVHHSSSLTAALAIVNQIRVAFFRVEDRPSSDRSTMHLTAIQLDSIDTMSSSYRTRTSPMATSRAALIGR